MMQERLETMVLVFKAVELTTATVAVENVRYLAVQRQIYQKNRRQAQPVGPRDKDYTHSHDQTAEKLVKIFRQVELPAGTTRTTVEHVIGVGDGTQLMPAIRTHQIRLPCPGDLNILLAFGTVTGNNPVHKVIPNLMRKYL